MSKALITDLYEIRMSYVYFKNGMKDNKAYFDVFYRKTPDDGGFAIYCGLEHIIDYVSNFHFDKDEIDFLRETKEYSEDFLEYLSNLKFSGSIKSMKEGSVIFPQEPVLRIEAPIIEAQLLETYLLMIFNHESLIATKANRIIRSAQGRSVVEFGARRAHNETAALYGARSAYIGGCLGTSVVECEKRFGIKSFGTMAHSFVQSYENEYEAFKAFALAYPNQASFLIDTYDCLGSGINNAIKVFKEILEPMGIKKGSVRIDSGDLSYLSNEIRKILDSNGLEYVTIMLTNSLDEDTISDLLLNNASVDTFGVGERLITSSSSPILDGVYKMCAIEKNGELIDVIKLSASPTKTTNPGLKKVYRLIDKETLKAEADLITCEDEEIDFSKPITLYDQHFTYKNKEFKEYQVRELLVDIFKDGKLVYNIPSVNDVKEYCKCQVHEQWAEVKRFHNPHEYYVDLSDKLYNKKKEMIKAELHE